MEFLTHCARTYGEISSFRIFKVPVYLISRPEYIETVLSTRARSFVKGRSMRAARPLLGEGLFLAEGAPWIRLRQLNQPGFRRDRVAGFAQTTLECTERMIARWRDGDVVNIHAAMNELTVQIVARAMLGINVESDTAEIGASLHTILEYFRAQLDTGLLIPPSFPTPGNLRMKQALKRLESVVARIVQERRTSPHNSTDLLSSLVHPADGVGHLTDQELRDEVITILVAGHETTAASLTWMWILLSQHPDSDARIASEIVEAIGDRPVALEDRSKLPFAEHVLRETVRLYPPAWTTPRMAVEDCRIGDFVLKPGTSVSMSQWVMHRDPRYFENPLCFEPDRWAGGLLERLPPFAYFPFGGGPRGCIGEAFAMSESLLILATIAQRFRLRLIDTKPVLPWPTLTLQPRGPVAMKVELRCVKDTSKN